MKFAQKLAVLVLALTFLSAPMARAEQDETSMREPAAAKKKKKQGKAKASHRKAKKKAAKKASKAKRAARPKSHAPAHPAPAGGNTGVPDPYSDVSNEKKDDLPPPANTEPKDE